MSGENQMTEIYKWTYDPNHLLRSIVRIGFWLIAVAPLIVVAVLLVN